MTFMRVHNIIFYKKYNARCIYNYMLGNWSFFKETSSWGEYLNIFKDEQTSTFVQAYPRGQDNTIVAKGKNRYFCDIFLRPMVFFDFLSFWEAIYGQWRPNMIFLYNVKKMGITYPFFRIIQAVFVYKISSSLFATKTLIKLKDLMIEFLRLQKVYYQYKLS